MKYLCAILIAAIFLGDGLLGLSQGFANLGFESADLAGYSPGSIVPTTNAFPGWVVSAPYIFYDNVSLSGGSITIWDTNSDISPHQIQGEYCADFASVSTPGYDIAISLGQNGIIPISTRSIIFWGDIGSMQVTFDDQPLLFSAIGNGTDYTIYAADISAYAGQTGELLFTVAPYTVGATLDNIQFSSTPVPEPSELALAILGAVLMGFRRWQTPRHETPHYDQSTN